jgi:hypothetical protein
MGWTCLEVLLTLKPTEHHLERCDPAPDRCGFQPTIIRRLQSDQVPERQWIGEAWKVWRARQGSNLRPRA